MTYDATYLNTIHAGARALITVAVPAVSGLTFTISSPPTFTLRDSDGNVVFGPVSVTSYDASAQPSPTAWYSLDTISPQVLAAGTYVGVFTVAYSDDAASPRSYREELEAQIAVLAPVEIAGAAYDPTAPTGQVRLLAADTDLSDPVWSDAEIASALALTGGNVFLAAGLLLDAAATDASKIALIARLGRDLGDLSRIPEMLRESAAAVRQRTAAQIQTNPPDQVFSTDSGGGTVTGTTTVW
jgi:hypothetical protein